MTMWQAPSGGPLAGLRVIEFAGIGPAPFCAMLLGDLGADVIRIDRPATGGGPFPPGTDLLTRSRRSVCLDLKTGDGVAAALRLTASADAVIEGFRPGVMERLGLGPEACFAENPRLVYGRMTGFGQDGPFASAAGHDINYIALSGALHAIGRRGDRPLPPLNLVGDFGGGAVYLAFGILAALFERSRSGLGQVVDAAMVDGATSLMTMFFGMRAAGLWEAERGGNVLAGGVPYYDSYQTSDGEYVAIGAMESGFFAEAARRIGLDERFVGRHDDPVLWPEMRTELTRIFLTRSRAEWAGLLEGSDACVTGIYAIDELAAHPQVLARGGILDVAGIPQPAPAPRFSRTPAAVPTPPCPVGAHTTEILAELGDG